MEAALLAILIAAFLCGVPLAGITAGRAAAASSARPRRDTDFCPRRRINEPTFAHPG
jgi:hypothetical protein